MPAVKRKCSADQLLVPMLVVVPVLSLVDEKYLCPQWRGSSQLTSCWCRCRPSCRWPGTCCDWPWQTGSSPARDWRTAPWTASLWRTERVMEQGKPKKNTWYAFWSLELESTPIPPLAASLPILLISLLSLCQVETLYKFGTGATTPKKWDLCFIWSMEKTWWSVADPGSGAFMASRSGIQIRDGKKFKNRIRDPGWTLWILFLKI